MVAEKCPAVADQEHAHDVVADFDGLGIARCKVRSRDPLERLAVGLLLGDAGARVLAQLAVDENHETNIENLYAVGECASRYHGANRLGGNSLLAAIYSGMTAAESIGERPEPDAGPEASADIFSEYIESEKSKIVKDFASESRFPVMYIRDMAAEIMNKQLGIVRDGESLRQGINDLDYYIDIASRIRYDSSVLEYFNYSLPAILNLAKATLLSAYERKESRGSHIRSDHPETGGDFAAASIVSYNDGEFDITYDREGRFEH